jgi:hypothetical protein
MSLAITQLVVLLVAMLASGAIGYWVAREKYRGAAMNYGGHKPLPDGPVPRARMAPTVQ